MRRHVVAGVLNRNACAGGGPGGATPRDGPPSCATLPLSPCPSDPLPPYPSSLPCDAADQLKLLARLPVTNPNYMAATLEGDMHVLFYEAVAGRGAIQRRRLPPRAAPKDVDV